MIERLTQEEADKLLKYLYSLWECGPFSGVFLAEYSRMMIDEPIWALPEKERMYFLGTVENNRYLFGIKIFPASIDISSLGKIAGYDPHISGKSITKNSKSVICLRELIQDHLVPLAKDLNTASKDGKKLCIIAHTLPAADGPSLFAALIESHKDRPLKGISEHPYSTYEHHELILKLS